MASRLAHLFSLDRHYSLLAEFRYIQVWHPRMDSEPANQWRRRMFAESAVPE